MRSTKNKGRGAFRLAACALCASAFALLAGCVPAEPPDPGTALREEIVSAYIEETRADLRPESLAHYDDANVIFEAYYGLFDGHAVFSLHDGNFGYTAAEEVLVIDGVYICTNSDGEANPLVYLSAEADSEHRVLSLAVAYERGFLGKSDLRQIARCMRAWQDANAPGEKYSLTAGEGADFLLEPLPAEARAGERILFRTDILMDADIVAYLNGERLPAYTPVQEDGDFVAWEFGFTMPAEDAVIDLKVEGGLLPA